MKIYKPERLLAWILAVAMIVQACPVSAFAADYTDDAMIITEQEESQDAEAPEKTVAAADETLELEQAEPAQFSVPKGM